MMNFPKAALYISVMLLSLTLAVSAQQTASTQQPSAVPRLVKYSGVVKDAVGKPRSGTVGLTLAMYAEQEGGATLWLETQNVELDEQGRYAVLLGAQTKDGLPLELFASGEPRWLGVQVNLPGEVEQARVLLVSVPYALKAADADTLGGQPASSFLTLERLSGSSGVGALSSGKSAGEAVTTVGAQSLISGSTGFLARFTSPTDLGSSILFDTGTAVGIGTSTPGALLDVNGGARALSFGFSGNAAVPTNATATIFNQANVGPTFSGFNFSVRTGVTPADALTVDASQNVSITGNSSALAYKFTGNAAPPTDATATIFNQAFVGPVFSGLSFRVRTGVTPADALTVDQNQRVGIGTVFPTQRLEVAGGNLKITGAGNGVIFPDGTVQKTAAVGGAGGPYSNASLNGRYAFSEVGAFPSGGFLYVVNGIGTLQADGNGNIVSGSITELNSGSTVTCQGTLTGTYSVTASGQGTVSLTVATTTFGCTGNTSTFSIQVAQQGASVVWAESDSAAWIAGSAFRQ